jgi:hypothetical protein
MILIIAITGDAILTGRVLILAALTGVVALRGS